MVKISTFNYHNCINNLFIGLSNGIVSDGQHKSDLTGNWVINTVKFDTNAYYISVGVVTGFDTRSASVVWPDWGKDTVTYTVEFVSPVMYCPIITDSMMIGQSGLNVQYRQQVLDWAFAQL